MLTSLCMLPRSALECPFFFFNCRIKLCLGPMSVCVGVVRRISYLCRNVEDEGMVIDSPHTGLLLSTSSKIFPTTTLDMASTSGHAAISSCDQQDQVRADWGFGASARVPFIRSNIHCVDLSPPLNS